MRNWSIVICRYLLAGIFVFNGINMLFQFMPIPRPDQPEIAQRFLRILSEAGYFFPIIGIVKLLTGISLITNRYLPLMLIVMFPISLNGILFHLRMDAEMSVPALIIGCMQVYLIYINKEKYLPMLSNGNKK